MKHNGEPKGGVQGKKTNQVFPLHFCIICSSTHETHINQVIFKRICRTCTQRIKRERDMTSGQVRARSKKVIAYVICHVFSQRGYKAAKDVAIKLLDILDA